MKRETRWLRALDELRDIPFYEKYLEDIRAIAYLGIVARKELLKIARIQRSTLVNRKIRKATSSGSMSFDSPQEYSEFSTL
jgi:hypothetical protein